MAKGKRPFDPATLPRYEKLQTDEARRRRELLTGITDEGAEPIDPFEVRTEVFTGPLDLLIYLLREGEIELDQLPILPVVEQYLSYLLTLNQEFIDVNLAAESVSIIAQILDMKLKLKGLLNAEEEEGEETGPESDQPRLDLIAELMELQRLKRMTLKLAERFEEWQYRPGRPEDAAPMAPVLEGDDLIIPPAQIVAAFKAIVEQVNAHVNEATIPREEVTLEEQILVVLAFAEREERCAFHRLFEDIGHKEMIVTTFIAVLELTRQGKIVISQPEPQGPIYFEAADKYRARMGIPAPGSEAEQKLAPPPEALGTPAAPGTDAAATAAGDPAAPGNADPAAGAPPGKKSPFGKGKGEDDGAAGATDLSDLFTSGEDDLDEEGQNMKQRIDSAIKIYHRVSTALDAYQHDGVILSATEAAERAGVENISVEKLKGERWWQKKKNEIAIGDQVALGEQLAAELASDLAGVERALAADESATHAGDASDSSAPPHSTGGLSLEPPPTGLKLQPPAQPPANKIAIQIKTTPANPAPPADPPPEKP